MVAQYGHSPLQPRPPGPPDEPFGSYAQDKLERRFGARYVQYKDSVNRSNFPRIGSAFNFSTEMAPKPEQCSVPNEFARLDYRQGSPTMTTPASGIREEVWELIEAQIKTFGRHRA